MNDKLKKNLNVPNALTLVRLLLIPVFVVLYVRGENEPALRYWSLAVFSIACFTDLLDGYIARKYNQITDLGKLMDPLADKVMVLTATLSLAISINETWLWIVLGILLFKELFMVIGGSLLLKHGIVVYSYMIGKVAHCLCIAGVVSLFFHPLYAGMAVKPDMIVLIVAVCCTLCAMAFYTTDSVRKAKAAGIIGKKRGQE